MLGCVRMEPDLTTLAYVIQRADFDFAWRAKRDLRSRNVPTCACPRREHTRRCRARVVVGVGEDAKSPGEGPATCKIALVVIVRRTPSAMKPGACTLPDHPDTRALSPAAVMRVRRRPDHLPSSLLLWSLTTGRHRFLPILIHDLAHDRVVPAVPLLITQLVSTVALD